MASCFMICLELSAVCIWTECVFYSETENYPLWYYWETALCKLAFCAAMRQMCYVVKNVLIFKIADSCFGLLSGSLIYSGFIFLSWALLLAVVGLFHCVATVRVENLHSVPYWPVYRHTVLSNSWYDAVCLRGRERILCIGRVWFPSSALCVYVLSAHSHFIRQHPKAFRLTAELCNCPNCWRAGKVERLMMKTLLKTPGGPWTTLWEPQLESLM